MRPRYPVDRDRKIHIRYLYLYIGHTDEEEKNGKISNYHVTRSHR